MRINNQMSTSLFSGSIQTKNATSIFTELQKITLKTINSKYQWILITKLVLFILVIFFSRINYFIYCDAVKYFIRTVFSKPVN